MNAYAIIHFGNNIKYIEYEIYQIINLRKFTKCDIIYLYSETDTPTKYLKIFKLLCKDVIPYNDNNITYNIKFDSYYEEFNTIRTCNFIFANKLTKYKKVCIIESDLLILKSIDDVFSLKTPSIFKFIKPRINMKSQQKIILDHKLSLESCKDLSSLNGGIILIEPSEDILKKSIDNISKVIKYKCKYPNETLFLISYDYFYNLPIGYNLVSARLHTKDSEWIKLINSIDIKVIHYAGKKWKPIDNIKDNWKSDNKIEMEALIKYKKFVSKYIRVIENLLK
jgi:alpha-N-acetylglucosamine transferase